MRLGRDDDLARRGVGLQPRGEVGGFAAGGQLGGRGAGADFSDDDQAGGDADAGLQRVAALRLERCNRREHVQSRVHRALGVVLVRTRVAEVDQAAVAEQLRDMAVVGRDRAGHRLVIDADQALQVFGVERCREQRRADEIAEHHGELAPLGFAVGWRRFDRRQTLRLRQRGDRHPQALAVAEQRHPELLQVGVVELRQQVELDALRDERRGMLGQAERLEPIADVVHFALEKSASVVDCGPLRRGVAHHLIRATRPA